MNLIKFSAKGMVLVTLQFACLLYLLATTPPKLSVAGLILLGASLLLLSWSVITMRKSKLRILPDPAKHAKLITSGPYRMIRHPMYTSLIIGSLALVITHATLERLIGFFVLLVTLWLKLSLEEDMLTKKFPEYANYKKKTYRILPYIV